MLILFSLKFLVKRTKKIEGSTDPLDKGYLIKLSKSIYRANKFAFWSNSCIVSSLAVRWILNGKKIPSKLYIGAGKDKKGEFLAHAWLEVNEGEIVKKEGDFIILFVY